MRLCHLKKFTNNSLLFFYSIYWIASSLYTRYGVPEGRVRGRSCTLGKKPNRLISVFLNEDVTFYTVCKNKICVYLTSMAGQNMLNSNKYKYLKSAIVTDDATFSSRDQVRC